MARKPNWKEVHGLETLFCDVDDFCRAGSAFLAADVDQRPTPTTACGRLTSSEVMTILIAFHRSDFRTFKHFYLMLRERHRAEFPEPGVVPTLCRVDAFGVGPVVCLLAVAIRLLYRNRVRSDSTALAVCGNKRIQRNRVFRGLAKIGKTTMGWFFGFKLHLAINECGELLAVQLTPGNIDDRQPVPHLTRRLFGKLFGDKGYISAELFTELWERGLQLITHIRCNMTNRLMPLLDKILLRKRLLIETVNDQLKNILQIEHTRHRSPRNFLVNLLAGLIQYTHQPKKPSLRLGIADHAALARLLLPNAA